MYNVHEPTKRVKKNEKQNKTTQGNNYKQKKTYPWKLMNNLNDMKVSDLPESIQNISHKDDH